MLDTHRRNCSPAVTKRSVIAPVAILAVAAGSWVLALGQMRGMDMGVATDPGSFGAFIALWVPMMAAMMLPGTVPAVTRRAWSMTSARNVPLFVAVYLAVWAVVGTVVYVLYRPHGTTMAGVVVLAAGIYELTPLKTRSRRRCRTEIRSSEFSLACVGSSIGLTVAFVALGFMSVTWMIITSALVLAQKILPAQRALDVAVALAIATFGVLILTTPASIPGLMPSM